MGNAWNSGTCCGLKENSPTDDFAFTRTVVGQVREKLCVDNEKVWASGFSNGAMMAEVLACKANDVFSAVASVSGVVELQPGNRGGLKACDEAVKNSTKRTAVLNVHGDFDPMGPWQSDPIAGFPSIPDNFKAWGERSGCTGAPATVFQKGKYTIQRYSSCANGAQFDLVKNHGGSHEWPSDSDFDTTAYMHDFFNNVSGIEYVPEFWTPMDHKDAPISVWPEEPGAKNI